MVVGNVAFGAEAGRAAGTDGGATGVTVGVLPTTLCLMCCGGIVTLYMGCVVPTDMLVGKGSELVITTLTGAAFSIGVELVASGGAIEVAGIAGL